MVCPFCVPLSVRLVQPPHTYLPGLVLLAYTPTGFGSFLFCSAPALHTLLRTGGVVATLLLAVTVRVTMGSLGTPVLFFFTSCHTFILRLPPFTYTLYSDLPTIPRLYLVTPFTTTYHYLLSWPFTPCARAGSVGLLPLPAYGMAAVPTVRLPPLVTRSAGTTLSFCTPRRLQPACWFFCWFTATTATTTFVPAHLPAVHHAGLPSRVPSSLPRHPLLPFCWIGLRLGSCGLRKNLHAYLRLVLHTPDLPTHRFLLLLLRRTCTIRMPYVLRRPCLYHIDFAAFAVPPTPVWVSCYCGLPQHTTGSLCLYYLRLPYYRAPAVRFFYTTFPPCRRTAVTKSIRV